LKSFILFSVFHAQSKIGNFRCDRDRGRHDQYIEDEERLEMLGCTTDTIHDTPLHLTEFDNNYIRDFDGEMLMRPPVDTCQHTVTNYSKS
jgi:hypothetical protein